VKPGLKERLRQWARERRAQRDARWPVRSAAPGGRSWPLRVLYLCPDSTVVTGGIKVIYQHVETLRRLGVDAYVLHQEPGFRCRWFESDAPVLHWRQMRLGDRAVVPEVVPQQAERLRLRGVPYSMFVQNGYLLFESAEAALVRQVYEGAEAVLSISEDTSALLRRWMPALGDRLLRVQPRIDPMRFVSPTGSAPNPPAARERLVTYMPRKMPQQARLLARWLVQEHPGWRFEALDGLPESAVAAALQRSRIFLAFGAHEGFGLPPVEAALAGNLVLGYHGQGGQEFFTPPLFHAVPPGDALAFLDRFAELTRASDAAGAGIAETAAHAAARAALAARYGPDAEAGHLHRVAQRLGWLDTPAQQGSARP
jgi:hypothetical protein